MKVGRKTGWLVVAIAGAMSGPSIAHATDIFGTWMRGDKAARVVIAKCGPAICATNVWIRDPARQHENVGDQLVFKISRRDDIWSGTAYDPQRHLNFSVTLKADRAGMTTRGCMFGGLVCKNTTWTRQ